MILRKYHIYMFLVFLSIAVLIGCTKHPPIEDMSVDDAFTVLTGLYDDGKYLRAVEGLGFFTLNYSGDARVDSAQFLLGMSHFKLEEFLLAADTFNELVRRFPRSALVPESMYMVGDCYWQLSPRYSLDQDYTDNAIDALQSFIDYFPNYEKRVQEAQELIFKCRIKLAHKRYANGIIYFKMKDYKAAIIYFNGVIDEFYDTEWAPRAIYQLGRTYIANREFIEATKTLEAFIEKYPDHPLRTRAEMALKQAYDESQETEIDDEDIVDD